MTADPDHAPTTRVRPREQADLAACGRLLGEVHAQDGYPRNRPAEPAGWLSPPALLAAWVAESGGRLVGHVALCRDEGDASARLWAERPGRSGAGPERAGVVSRLFVSPAARGLGVGGLLMAEVARGASARGLHPVLDVLASDAAAAALYERLNWQRLATVEERWGPGETVTVHCYAAPA
ncbi:GNAT family N-acetyltransferase [Streptomyces sp. H27-D2]|uniref:GNAT family N-acetyltransferase n=1 Tax=Streptomyces sp. H27-D2 TaxID=3046304 RepID=UPI002DB7E8D0|nr:GNAT family N-acetyltransferase [Streptomyces sp. H27-D2]MEC4018164.1 GNAT family N-acetyltransferase [Streptomyces sp. H27-D2]